MTSIIEKENTIKNKPENYASKTSYDWKYIFEVAKKHKKQLILANIIAIIATPIIVKIAIKSLLTVVPTNSSTVDRSVTKYEDTVPLPNVSYSVIETLFNLDMRECLIL